MNSTHRTSRLEAVRQISRLMDSQFTAPGGFKFGLDALIGLVPVVGDLVTSLFSTYIIVEAARAGCSPVVLARMALNVLIENIVGLIPLVGNIFDFVWKANNKNVELFERALMDPESTRRRSAGLIAIVVFSICALIFGFFYLAIQVFKFLLEALGT